ncbi:sulfite exporter TauE/SafE family protein [Psychrosphaera sp. B3R10]|uniref:Probable membrane transporter protein n=1 Tax=Psychrosphaera algicola TaxID=3023714 RepID=A0ABT5FDQ0_9GAMM|nr:MULTISPECIES: sulfite exporter TauE/SafE family protein [unclassified Psychrosphaera]MBU2882613.1 sulfite exporter TauE/SafE family protein [Psychrosphaera sp. I2R16]MBU2989368.1 sulfite exporter TauE/SafE family protein [Psychrosphaera sp. B3R10]MDC2889481.1 sulfite exporter TauE/SafE family protein [Psychrosphaera sp. G1-22]MDO6718202.1 sulfite exporter TauE/SafE family protein [Psychrosphaera sp. 1_MG-2023]
MITKYVPLFDLIKSSPMRFVFLFLLCFSVFSLTFDDYSPFALLGMIGALFANVTGAGGGVVFIPAFQNLGLSESQSVATSFAIQCFGMTTGAIVWLKHVRVDIHQHRDWQLLVPFLAVCVPTSMVGLWSVYLFDIQPPASLTQFFAWFSVMLGSALFITIYLKYKKHQQEQLTAIGHKSDLLILALISFIGGVITAFLSVGVGEFVAFYLILRGYRVTLAVAVAVVLSATTVWAGVGHHIANGNIYYEVLWYAGPGAVIGGIVAKMVATRLPVLQLKLLFAGWVFVVGCIEFV